MSLTPEMAGVSVQESKAVGYSTAEERTSKRTKRRLIMWDTIRRTASVVSPLEAGVRLLKLEGMQCRYKKLC